MSILFPTWKEYEAATPEEQRLFWGVLIETWRNNADDQIAADVRFDRSEEMREWIDEYTSIGDDAERIRQAGRMTVVRNRGTKSMNVPATKTQSELLPAERFITMIERICLDPTADLDKLDRMLAMREREQARIAEQEFNSALAKAQADMDPIRVDSANPQTRSKYASFAALDRGARPAYTSAGFGLTFDTEEIPGQPDQVRVICDVLHASGHKRRYSIPMTIDGRGARGGDVMTKTHAMGSGVSYGMRYLLRMIFNLAVDHDDDRNAAGGRTRQAAPYQQRQQHYQHASTPREVAEHLQHRVDDYKQRTVAKSGPGGTTVYDYDPNTGEIQEPSTALADKTPDVVEEAAASQASPPLSESAAATDEFPADSTARFVADCREKIVQMTYSAAVQWWNQVSEIKKRNDFGLSSMQIEELRNLIKAKKVGPQ